MKDQHKNIHDYWSNINFSASIYSHEKEDFYPKLLELAREGNYILEIGAGDGRILNNLSKDLSSHIGDNKKTIIGVDFTNKLKNINALRVRADGFNLPFPDCFFDLVYSTGVVEHYSKKQTRNLIKEHVRVTKIGGYVMVKVPMMGLKTINRFKSYLTKKQFKIGSFNEIRGRNLTFNEIFDHFKITNLQILEYKEMSNAYKSAIIRKNSFLRQLFGEHLYVCGFKT